MIYSDVVSTLSLIVAFVAAVPGMVACRKLYEESRVKVEAFYEECFYSPKDQFFLTLKVTPGAKPIRISSIEAEDCGLSVAKGLTEFPLSVDDCPSQGETKRGPLDINWFIARSSEFGKTRSAILFVSNSNKSSLEQIRLILSWEVDTKSRLKYTHKSTLIIRLITKNRETIRSPHAEIML